MSSCTVFCLLLGEAVCFERIADISELIYKT